MYTINEKYFFNSGRAGVDESNSKEYTLLISDTLKNQSGKLL